MSLNPTQKLAVRKQIVYYTTVAEANRLNRSYTQQRPGLGYMLDPAAKQFDDCSMYVSKVFNWAMHKCGVYLRDPLDEHYTGYGYTGTMYNWLQHTPAPENKYLVGDMAIWGTPSNTIHTAVCRKAGTKATALFSSHGHQSWSFNSDAPNAYTIAQDTSQQLVGVYRHPALL